MSHTLKTIAAAILVASAVPCYAEAVPADQLTPDTIRLSPAQREAALEYGATRSANELPINGLDRKIHGEVGMEIGSNGSRAMFGTATVPLGDTGSATVSFLNANGGRYRYR